MSRRVPLLMSLVIAAAACSDRNVPTTPPVAAATQPETPRAAREHLARVLAIALKDPATRAAVKRRLDASNAPEGKVQFQALVQSDQGTLLTSLARAGATSATDLLANLDAARGLELYLPVAAQRAAWTGDARYLVGTIGSDGETPVGFDPSGARRTLDPKTPPDLPVLALVPQETDFTRGHPERMINCVDVCDAGSSGGTSNNGGSGPNSIQTPGLYLVQSHFGDTYESWLKGQPEYEYHVYGLGDGGTSIQLACTGERAGGASTWDQNNTDWTGSAMLLSDADYNAYQVKHPGAPIRIVAWEDDDEACIDHVDVVSVSALITAVDKAYKAVTSGKEDPWYIRGIRAAPSVFSLLTAMHNIILTNDDFIGNAVEGTVTHDAPNGANWVVKTAGTVTTGWFSTLRVQ